MIYALVEYKNGNGKIMVKAVTTQEELDNMVKNLDRRIEKGTCLGYIVTTL